MLSLRLVLFVPLMGGNTMAKLPTAPAGLEAAFKSALNNKTPVIMIGVDEKGKYHSFVRSGVTQPDPGNHPKPPKKFKHGEMSGSVYGHGSPDCIFYTIGGQLRMICW